MKNLISIIILALLFHGCTPAKKNFQYQWIFTGAPNFLDSARQIPLTEEMLKESSFGTKFVYSLDNKFLAYHGYTSMSETFINSSGSQYRSWTEPTDEIIIWHPEYLKIAVFDSISKRTKIDTLIGFDGDTFFKNSVGWI